MRKLALAAVLIGLCVPAKAEVISTPGISISQPPGSSNIIVGTTPVVSGNLNGLLYDAAGNVVGNITTVNSGVLVTSAGGVPSISTTLPNGLALGTPVSATLTNATGLPLSTGVTGTLSDAQLANAYSGVGACGANLFAVTLTRNAAPTCAQPTVGNLANIAGGTVVANNTVSSAAPAATIAPVLGVPSVSTGSVGFANAGSANTLTMQSAAIATANRTVTFPDPGANDSVVYVAATQTLTGKTISNGTLSGTTNVSQGTITANAAALNITATWNNGVVTFDAPLFENITDTASAAGSLLEDLQKGGVSQFTVGKNGTISSVGTANLATGQGSGTYAIMIPAYTLIGNMNAGSVRYGASDLWIYTNGNPVEYWNATTKNNLISTMPLGWSAGSDPTAAQSAGLSIAAAGIVSVDTSTVGDGKGSLLRSYTFGSLPAAPTRGDQAVITDQTAACSYGATPVGLGGNTCKVWFNGTSWIDG